MKDPTIFKTEAGREAILRVYDDVLQRWPVAYHCQQIMTSLGSTFVIECGQPAGPALVLLHGAGSNSAFWMGEVADLCSDWRVLLVDIPGEAGKSEPRRAGLAGDAHTAWLGEVFDALGVERAALVGLSLGGFLALKFASAHAEKISHLALISSSGIAPQKTSFLFTAVILMAFGNWGLERLVRMVNANQPVPREVMDYSKLIHREFSPRLEVVPLLSDAELKRLTMPVLVWMGAKDVLLNSRASMARIEELIPQAEVELAESYGHVLPGMGARIKAFLNQHP